MLKSLFTVGLPSYTGNFHATALSGNVFHVLRGLRWLLQAARWTSVQMDLLD